MARNVQPGGSFRRWGLHAGVLVGAIVASMAADQAVMAQGGAGQSNRRPPTEITQVRHNSGQPVIPYFEGWIRNADGTFDMVFGYFNRNYVQEIAVPVGADNNVEPLGGDTGQPTYFLPRRQRWAYRVRVPANFGKQAVVWSVTTNGRTERAYGELIPEQEISERVVMTNGNFDPGHGDLNKPPSLKTATTLTAKVGERLPLTVVAEDDGLPKPEVAPPPPPPPTDARPGTNPFTAQVNSSGPRRRRGLSVSWTQYRGPAKADVESTGPVELSGTRGEATTRATFAEPGTYVLVASASDGAMSVKQQVTVTVTR